MGDREVIVVELMVVLGESGCVASCEEATIYQDNEGWKMMLEGFMELWKLGTTVEEAKTRIREYAQMFFGRP